MSYTKQNFVKGQTLKADHMNHIEDGISTLSEEIVKSINGIKPDANGNITLPIYNGEVADE